jgi:hypothetical protein
MKSRLARLAHARSGDKGDRSDIGLFAFDAAGYDVLKRVAAHFAWLAKGPVRIWPLDNLLALKIVIDGALSGGGTRSLRSDNLGKTIAAALLRMEVEVREGEANVLRA